MQTSKGKIQRALKVILYGPEGIGKSTFASMFPAPIFIDVEGSTYDLDVIRTAKRPESWSELFDQINDVKRDPGDYQSLIIDTADWSEMLAIQHITNKYGKGGIEEFGYSKGYIYLAEEFNRLLAMLNEVLKAGLNVVVTAHAKMRKFEQPDELGAYDRWELKLTKNVAPTLKEWADLVLFINYKTNVIKSENPMLKSKVQGGKRVMYAAHHPCWDAKNRQGLPDEMPFDYQQISHLFLNKINNDKPKAQPKMEIEANADQAIDLDDLPDEQTKRKRRTKAEMREAALIELERLMELDGITLNELQDAVGEQGFYTADINPAEYELKFINDVLLADWQGVVKVVKENREA